MTLNFVSISVSVLGIFIKIIYSHFYKKGFIESYKKFREELNSKLKKDIKKTLRSLSSNLDRKPIEEIVEIWRKKAAKFEELNIPALKYLEIHRRSKWVYTSFVGSILFSLFSFKYPDGKLFNYLYSDIGFFLLIVGILLLIWVVWVINKLESQVIKHQIGHPIEEILKDEEN